MIPIVHGPTVPYRVMGFGVSRDGANRTRYLLLYSPAHDLRIYPPVRWEVESGAWRSDNGHESAPLAWLSPHTREERERWYRRAKRLSGFSQLTKHKRRG